MCKRNVQYATPLATLAPDDFFYSVYCNNNAQAIYTAPFLYLQDIAESPRLVMMCSLGLDWDKTR